MQWLVNRPWLKRLFWHLSVYIQEIHDSLLDNKWTKKNPSMCPLIWTYSPLLQLSLAAAPEAWTPKEQQQVSETVSAPRFPLPRGDDAAFSHIWQENTVYLVRRWRQGMRGWVNRGEWQEAGGMFEEARWQEDTERGFLWQRAFAQLPRFVFLLHVFFFWAVKAWSNTLTDCFHAKVVIWRIVTAVCFNINYHWYYL